MGGGIVGLATARALLLRFDATVTVLETEGSVAAHQTGHNSGVLHSGLYYKPGSMKARLCAEGRRAMVAYCQEKGIPHEVSGKLVVATRPAHLAQLDDLATRGRANGLAGVRRLSAGEMKELEPHAAGQAALHVPETGIVDYVEVCRAFQKDVESAGGTVATGARVTKVLRRSGETVLFTPAGEVSARFVVACAGLQADRFARLCGVDPGLAIVPFRGEYYDLGPARRFLVRNLIYPVPDPAYPFLGVHFTRKLNGAVEAGPNAVLALAREGYSRTSFSLRDAIGVATTPGFWPFVRRHWRTGIGEMGRSFSRRLFVRALQELVPALRETDVVPGGAGVRAQAMDPAGRLVDDFAFVEAEGMVHVLNAPSPAATASIRIGEAIAQRSGVRFGLKLR